MSSAQAKSQLRVVCSARVEVCEGAMHCGRRNEDEYRAKRKRDGSQQRTLWIAERAVS